MKNSSFNIGVPVGLRFSGPIFATLFSRITKRDYCGMFVETNSVHCGNASLLLN